VLSLFGVATGAFGTGFVSALFPPVNAEAAVAIGVAVGSLSQAMAWVVGLSVGQTVGKVVVYEAARAGRRYYTWRRRKKPVTAASATQNPAGGWQRFRTWLTAVNQRLTAMMDGRWRTAAVMLLSASVGLPPLVLTVVIAGLIKQRRLDFVLCLLIGRLVRFAVIALPFLIYT